MQFFNRRGRGRSREEVIWFFSLSIFKVSLLYHLLFKEDVFNNSFWKICIKITNHVEPGLNLLEYRILVKTEDTAVIIATEHTTVLARVHTRETTARRVSISDT